MSIKRKVLVDVSYGMSFRNVVLNKTFWSKLTQEYDVHLITPLQIGSEDQKKLKISQVIDSSKWPRNLFIKILISLNMRALHIKRLMELSDFFLKQHLGWPLVSRYHETYRNQDNLNQALYFWPAVKRTYLGKFLKKIVSFFPIFHPSEKLFKDNDYLFLINTHNSEYNSVLIAQVSQKNKVPIVSFPMGLDNIMHGPFLFEPDLLFFWGPDQDFEFSKVQVRWNQNLLHTRKEMLGNLIFDTLDQTKEGEAFDENEEKVEKPFFLFTTMPEDDHPGQEEICKTIVDYLRTNHLPHKLVIRLRPGHDDSMWQKFKLQNSDEVILQIPSGISFDKSGAKNNIDLSKEILDISNYSSTIYQSEAVISRALSTTYTDSLFIGTPAITTQYYPYDKNRSEGFHEMWKQICTFYPHYQTGYKFVFNAEELIEFLKGIIDTKKELSIDENQINFLNQQFYVDEEAVGDRAFEKIKQKFS